MKSTNTNHTSDPIQGVHSALDTAANSAVASIQEAVAERDRPKIARYSGILDVITQMQSLAAGLTGTSAVALAPRIKRAYHRKNQGNTASKVSAGIVGAINESAAAIKPKRGRKPTVHTDGETNGKRRGNRAFKAPAGTTTSAKEFRPHLLAAFDAIGHPATFIEAQTKMFETMQNENLLRENDLRTTKGTEIPRWRACTAATRKSLIVQHIIKPIAGYSEDAEAYELTSQGRKELNSWKNTKQELATA